MNAKLIQEFNSLNDIPAKSLTLFSHILSAHHIWNHRILNETSGLKVWHDIPKREYQSINTDNHRVSLSILDHKDLSDQISYSNSKGEFFSNSIQDILFHVINHSNYHRAQIASDFKAAGLTPIVSDYIFYKR
jgi:uncharacterized damage-inducible protein DinB